MLMVNELTGFGAGGTPAAKITYITSSQLVGLAGSSATRTFSSINLAAYVGKYVVCAIYTSSTSTVAASSVTANGNSLSSVATGTGTNTGVYFWGGLISSSANTDIVVVPASGIYRLGLAVWILENINSITPYHTTADSTPNPFSVSLNIPANGVGLGYEHLFNTNPTPSWSGLTQDFNGNIASGETSHHSGASGAFATAQSGLTVSQSVGTSGNAASVFASWSPAT